MFIKTTTAIFLSLSVALPTMASADYKRIRKAADFNAHVVGKKITFDGGWGIVHADGKTHGQVTRPKKNKYYGAWTWSRGYYCRNLVIGGTETGTNCQLVEVDGNKLRLTRDKGKGRVTEATMK